MNLKRILPIELNLEIKNFKEYFKKRTYTNKNQKVKSIYFLDSATYGNLGDQAIGFAISQFIKDNFKEYNYIEISEQNILRNLKTLKENIQPKDIICLTGGGNMGDLYPRYEAIRRKIIKQFKHNKIIVFPQTIDYSNDRYGQKQLANSIKIYNKHSNLIICAREEQSYKIMSKIYNNVILVPDIVFYLYKQFNLTEKKKSNTIGICLRNDKESLLKDNELNKIQQITSKNYKIQNITTICNQSLITSEKRKEIIYNKIKEFNNCNIIITDRLHGMIFSVLCNTPCIFLDNSNKKISGVYKTINKKISNIVHIDKKEIDNLNEYIEELMGKKCELNTHNLYIDLINAIKK